MSDFATKAQAAHRRIGEILLRDWDPIGVAHVPEAQDEYDAYIAEVYRLLSRRATTQEVFQYLWWIETQHMALRGDRQRTQKVAEQLAELVRSGIMPGSTT